MDIHYPDLYPRVEKASQNLVVYLAKLQAAYHLTNNDLPYKNLLKF